MEVCSWICCRAEYSNLRISVLFCRLVTVLIEVAGLLFVFGVWFWEVFRVMDTYLWDVDDADTSRWHSQRQTPAPVKISRKAQHLNPLQTLQCLQGQYSHTETFLTNFPCSKVRPGRTGGAGDSAGVVVLLRPRGGCVAGKIPAVWALASSGIFSAVLAESLQPQKH